MTQIINHNGEFVDAEQPLFTADNRAFMYGDALFETIRVVNGEARFLSDHTARLHRGMQTLDMQFPEVWDQTYFAKLIHDLYNQNQLSGAARLRWEVYRMPGGYYTPTSTDVGFILQMSSLVNEEYTLNLKGLSVAVFADCKKVYDQLANLKTSNSLCYVMAGIYKKQKGLDDCFIMNSEGNISETISSNVFVVKNGELYTPALSQACVAGIMRSQIIKIAKMHDKKIFEGKLDIHALMQADEIFITNAITGIQWVGAFRDKRYFNTSARWFLDQLNLDTV